MPRTFRLIEPNPGNGYASPFGIGDNGTPMFECIRLLSGSVDVEAKSTGTVTKLRHCFLSQKPRRPGNQTIEGIVDVVFDGDLKREDVKRFLDRAASENRKFWEELRADLCFCIACHKKKRGVEAFLYLYRVLELVSVAIPLVYASKLADYREAVRFVKSLSNSERDRDLSVLSNFNKAISKNAPLESLTIDFPFSGLPTSIASELVRQLQSYILADGKISYDFFSNPNEGVSIAFSSIPSFVVSCRNRLFHNAVSNDNFKLDPLGGAEPLCSTLVQPSLYWFAFILSEILKAHAARYV